MLRFPTLITIFICRSHYIPMSFSCFTNVVDTTTIQNLISINHPFSPDLHHFLHNIEHHFSHSLCGFAVVSWHLFSKFYPFHMHPPFVYFLDSKHFLCTNGTKEKQNLDLFPLQLPILGSSLKSFPPKLHLFVQSFSNLVLAIYIYYKKTTVLWLY